MLQRVKIAARVIRRTGRTTLRYCRREQTCCASSATYKGGIRRFPERRIQHGHLIALALNATRQSMARTTRRESTFSDEGAATGGKVMNRTIKTSLIRFQALLLLIIIPALVPAQQPEVAGLASTDKDAKSAVKTEKKSDPANPNPQDDQKFANQFRTTFEIGAQYLRLNGERSSKFEEHRRVRDGFLFRRFSVTANPESSPYFLNLKGRGPSETDQQYVLDIGKYGRFRTTVEWTALPSLYSTGSKSLFGSSAKGVLTIPDAVQTQLQSAADAELPGLVQNLLAETPFTTLGGKRQTFRFEQKFSITDKWSLRFKAVDQKRFGTRRLGNGSYERIGTPNGDTFRVLQVELPEPVDYRTDTFTLGTSYVEKKWGANFDYTYSQFRNNISTLIFDNPFRATDAQANPGGGTGRLRYASTAYDLAPDSDSHSLMFCGFIDLPHNSRVASALGWSFWRQNDAFLPFTQNTAIVAANLPSGVKPTDLEALPALSLNGEVDTFTQDHLFTSWLTGSLAVNLHYLYYDYDNSTPVLEFPGYAAYNESYWRTNIVNVPGTNPPVAVPIENEPVSFLKQNATAEIVWKITSPVTWRLEYGWEGWDRTHRNVAASKEQSITTTVSLFKSSNPFTARIKYRYSDRLPDSYDQGLKEFKLLRVYDQSRRLRHDTSLQWQWRAAPQLGLSGSFGYLSDDYDQHFFGLTKYIAGFGSIDALYTPSDKATFYVNYSREQIQSQMQSIAKTAAPFDLRNRWDRNSRDKVNTLGVGITTYLAKDRLAVDSHYAFSLADQRINAANPNLIVSTDALNAQAIPWPKIQSRLHEWNNDISYQLSAKWGLGFRYIYEPYRLDDFAWNGLSPYPISKLPAENDGKRFLLLDSRYSSYNANVIGFYLRFSFGGKEE
jgi:MtrB/PioB family decaheme-associated outer membrane protein